MPLYEHTFIARRDITAQQAEGLAETFAGILTENGGKVTKTEYWGLKTLAYRVKKNRKGHYLHLNLDSAPAGVAEMERQMRLNEDVIRFLTIKVDELEEGPSIVMQNKARGEDRPRRDDDRPRRDNDRPAAPAAAAPAAAAPADAKKETAPADAPAEAAPAVSDDASTSDKASTSEGESK